MNLEIRRNLPDSAIILVRQPHIKDHRPCWLWSEFRTQEEYDSWFRSLTPEERAAVQTFERKEG